jgi:hypothetical protein
MIVNIDYQAASDELYQILENWGLVLPGNGVAVIWSAVLKAHVDPVIHNIVVGV